MDYGKSPKSEYSIVRHGTWAERPKGFAYELLWSTDKKLLFIAVPPNNHYIIGGPGAMDAWFPCFGQKPPPLHYYGTNEEGEQCWHSLEDLLGSFVDPEIINFESRFSKRERDEDVFYRAKIYEEEAQQRKRFCRIWLRLQTDAVVRSVHPDSQTVMELKLTLGGINLDEEEVDLESNEIGTQTVSIYQIFHQLVVDYPIAGVIKFDPPNASNFGKTCLWLDMRLNKIELTNGLIKGTLVLS